MGCGNAFFYIKNPAQCAGFKVPRVGIEPTLFAEPDFESGASTNSATEALCQLVSDAAQLLLTNT